MQFIAPDFFGLCNAEDLGVCTLQSCQKLISQGLIGQLVLKHCTKRWAIKLVSKYLIIARHEKAKINKNTIIAMTIVIKNIL